MHSDCSQRLRTSKSHLHSLSPGCLGNIYVVWAAKQVWWNAPKPCSWQCPQHVEPDFSEVALCFPKENDRANIIFLFLCQIHLLLYTLLVLLLQICFHLCSKQLHNCRRLGAGVKLAVYLTLNGLYSSTQNNFPSSYKKIPRRIWQKRGKEREGQAKVSLRY